MMRFVKTFIVSAIFALLMPGAMALAATSSPVPTSSGQALEIAPPLLYLSGNPGQTIQTKIYLRDISNSPVVVSSTTNDFEAQGLNGTPKILLKQTGSDPYTLQGFVEPIAPLLLQPKQLKLLPLIIHIPANAAPGGHYGVLRFTATPASLSGGNGVSLSASLGSLILLTVNGNITEHLSIDQFNVTHNGHAGSFFQSDPLTFNEIVRNTGNVHVQPAGILTVTDMFGKKLVVMDVNRQQGNVLPSSRREFSQDITPAVVGNHRLFGRYSASITMTYGQSKQQVSDHLVFWVIPIKLIAGVVIGVIGGFFLLRWLIKRYNQYILSKAKK